MDNQRVIYALITRATGKIGESFARLLALEGYNLVLVDTHSEKLQSVAATVKKNFPSTDTICIQKDLTHESASQDLYREIKKKNLNIDLLINNEEIEQLIKPIEVKMSDINEERVSKNKFLKHPLTILFLKEMMDRNKGKILHFISTINRTSNINFSENNFDKPLVFSLIEIFQHKISEKLIEMNILNAQTYSIKLNISDDLDLRTN